jgi:hypothetical protein
MTAEAPQLLTITITDRDGRDPETVDARHTATPGLAVHPARHNDGWTLTHVPTGRCAGWWAEDEDPGRAMACGAALGALGPWGSPHPGALPLRDAWPVVLEFGGWVPDSHGTWWCLEAGELAEIVFEGDAAVSR